MDRKNAIVRTGIVTLAITLVGCRTFTSPARVQPIAKSGAYVVDYDASRRGTIVAPEGVKMNFVAEPPPDVAMATVGEFVGKANYQGISGEASAKVTESIAELGKRTQTVMLLRDALYRLGEMRMNGVIAPEQYQQLYLKVLDFTTQVSDAELKLAEAQLKLAEAANRQAEAQKTSAEAEKVKAVSAQETSEVSRVRAIANEAASLAAIKASEVRQAELVLASKEAEVKASEVAVAKAKAEVERSEAIRKLEESQAAKLNAEALLAQAQANQQRFNLDKEIVTELARLVDVNQRLEKTMAKTDSVLSAKPLNEAMIKELRNQLSELRSERVASEEKIQALKSRLEPR